jgi:hypothetical protein
MEMMRLEQRLAQRTEIPTHEGLPRHLPLFGDVGCRCRILLVISIYTPGYYRDERLVAVTGLLPFLIIPI